MRSATLRGRDHTRIGALAVVAEGPCAIALCRGGAAKTYAHTDPNEDAVGFAFGPAGAVIAVADGHDGASGAATAIAQVIDTFAPAWTGDATPMQDDDAWHAALLEALSAINSAIVDEARDKGLSPAPTTLSLAIVRQPEGRLFHASVGDSHVFPVRGGDAETSDVAWASLDAGRTYFVGVPRRDRKLPESWAHGGALPLEGLRAVALATDGLSETGIGVAEPVAAVDAAIAAAQAESRSRRPITACRGIARAALDAHARNAAGDNIASAVYWLADDAS